MKMSSANSRWKVRDQFFRGADTYEFRLKTPQGEKTIPLIVDELGYFHLNEPAPAGLYSFAEFIG